jgi:tRNA(Ile)-lysidine synthase
VRKIDVEKTIFSFLEQHVPVGEKLLLGYSGGLDSTALLMGLRGISQWPVHVIHVDHGWRPDSALQAQQIQKQVESLGFPISCEKLPPFPEKGNLEEWSRTQRYKVFLEVAKREKTSWLLVAHQADDQIEVVCKRFLEGASLLRFCGMRPIEKVFGLQVVRPLLPFRRSELQEWLGETFYIDDPTNKDQRFLRSRMREEIFPFLSRSFGKNVKNSIYRVSKEAALLNQFAHEEMEKASELTLCKGGAIAKLKEEHLHPFIAGLLVDTICEKAQIPALSRQQRDSAVETLCGEKGEVRLFQSGGGILFTEKGQMIGFSQGLEKIERRVCESVQGELSIGSWQIQWKPVEGAKEQRKVNWIELFQGKECCFYIPRKPFVITPSNEKLLRGIEKRGAPLSLRAYVPSIVQGFALVADPLSEYNRAQSSSCIKVSMVFKPKLPPYSPQGVREGNEIQVLR